jgi:hypothetical protein
MTHSSRGLTVTHRLALAALMFALLPGSRMMAQTPVEPADEALKRNVSLFEMALRGAVAIGGQKLAEKAQAIIPDITLRTDPPIVRGVRLPGYGLHFDVQAPDIQSTVIVLEMMTTVNRPLGQPQPVSQGQGRTTATGLVEADPMPGFNANREYSEFVREALIDALLDASGVFRLADNERLSVSAGGIDQSNTNLLRRERKLVISISGADLTAYRQGRITRDQAKERIVEDRF